MEIIGPQRQLLWMHKKQEVRYDMRSSQSLLMNDGLDSHTKQRELAHLRSDCSCQFILPQPQIIWYNNKNHQVISSQYASTWTNAIEAHTKICEIEELERNRSGQLVRLKIEILC